MAAAATNPTTSSPRFLLLVVSTATACAIPLAVYHMETESREDCYLYALLNFLAGLAVGLYDMVDLATHEEYVRGVIHVKHQ